MTDSGQRPATHRALDHQTMVRLARIVEDAAGGAPIAGTALDALAAEHGVEAGHLYASAAAITSVEIAREHKVSFVVCAGTCQNWGALECLQHLVELRRPRLKSWFKRAFDIEARACLNRCENGPVVRVHSRHGVAYIERADRDELSDAVKATCR